jgi:protein CpxP
MKHITSGRIASALIAATLLTSPMAMASDHGEHHRGKHDKAEM